MPTFDANYFITAIRQLANMETDPIVSDAEVLQRANEGLAALYDILIGEYEHYAVSTYDFTLAGGIGGNSVTLPTDFYKDVSLDKDPTTRPQTIHRMTSWVDRNSQARKGYTLLGSSLVFQPYQIAQGSYRLYYTPLPPVIALPTSITHVTGDDVEASSNAWFFNDGAFTSADIGQVLTVSGTVSNNGTFTITAVVGSQSINTTGPTHDEVTPDATVATYIPGGYQGTLPQIFMPWYEYIQVHAAIAIKSKIEQDTGDLESRLVRLQARVTAAASNRMEEGGQIAMANQRDSFWDDDAFPFGVGY
jgi:hypothetical protein